MKHENRAHGLGGRLLDAIEGMSATIFYMRTDSPWVTIAEAERYAHVSHGVLSDAISKGEVRGYRRNGGRVTLVHLRDIDEWIMSWQP